MAHANPEVGDIVHLKSGGPALTVAKIWQADRTIVSCYWFDVTDRIQHEDFLWDILDPLVEREPE
jgi:uncharacterized protein YodC (DUF2158 family)